MKIGDICQVISQPKTLNVCILGEFGFINDMNGDYASVETLRIDGSVKGCGSVPIVCLKKVEDPAWLKAKELHDEHYNKILQEGLDRSRRWQAKLEEVAEKNSLSKEKVELIYNELNNFSQYMR